MALSHSVNLACAAGDEGACAGSTRNGPALSRRATTRRLLDDPEPSFGALSRAPLLSDQENLFWIPTSRKSASFKGGAALPDALTSATFDLRRSQPVAIERTKMRKIIIAAAFTLGVTPSHAWQTRYYKGPWLKQCARVSTKEYCLVAWNSLLSPPQHFGMTCLFGPDGNTIDCNKE